jgi:3-oxoacyl-[acyl-carrier protein] reductase
VLGVNVAGTIWAVQAALPHLRRGGGRVVCVGSVAGRNGGGCPARTMARARAACTLRWLAKAEATNGILADAIAPGPIDTPMLQGPRLHRRRGAPQTVRARRGDRRGRRLPDLPGASYVTGTVIDANGRIFIG